MRNTSPYRVSVSKILDFRLQICCNRTRFGDLTQSRKAAKSMVQVSMLKLNLSLLNPDLTQPAHLSPRR